MDQTKIDRNSNIELLRIICMLLLIAHHLVVHGGILGLEVHETNKILSIIILPVGKICFDCFVTISTWFLVKAKTRGIKFIKIWLEVLFYNVIFLLVTLLIDKEGTLGINWRNWFGAFFPILGNSHGYAAAYLAFYLLIPFLKMIADKINKKQTIFIILFLLCTQVVILILGKFIKYTQNFNSEILLFVLCYFISLYMRRYQSKFQNNKILLISIFLLCWFIPVFFRIMNFSIAESEFSIINILGGYALFLLFYNIKIPTNKVINTFATTTFGILLIHDHNFFRYVFWSKIVKVPMWCNSSPMLFLCYVLLAVLAIFAVCAVIDFIRQKLLEKPILKSKPVKFLADKLDSIIEPQDKNS